MKTLVKSNDIIYISWVKSLLTYNQIEFIVLDELMSTTEGNICAIPVRIIVNEDDFIFAEKIIIEENNKVF
tara:strand:+ start:222 stop:434 length:213 start_codon:yes stop_codon:yes gene_type:complete